MELVWIIYLIEVICQPFIGLGFIVTMVGSVSIIGYILLKLDESAPSGMRTLPLGKIGVICGLILLFSNFIPSQKTAYLMLGAYGVQSIAETVGQNEDAQKIGKATLKLVNSAIERYKKELEVQTEKQVDSN